MLVGCGVFKAEALARSEAAALLGDVEDFLDHLLKKVHGLPLWESVYHPAHSHSARGPRRSRFGKAFEVGRIISQARFSADNRHLGFRVAAKAKVGRPAMKASLGDVMDVEFVSGWKCGK